MICHDPNSQNSKKKVRMRAVDAHAKGPIKATTHPLTSQSSGFPAKPLSARISGPPGGYQAAFVGAAFGVPVEPRRP